MTSGTPRVNPFPDFDLLERTRPTSSSDVMDRATSYCNNSSSTDSSSSSARREAENLRSSAPGCCTHCMQGFMPVQAPGVAGGSNAAGQDPIRNLAEALSERVCAPKRATKNRTHLKPH